MSFFFARSASEDRTPLVSPVLPVSYLIDAQQVHGRKWPTAPEECKFAS